MIKRKLSKWLLGIGAIALLVSSGCGKDVSSTPASLEKEPEGTVEASVDTENKEDNDNYLFHERLSPKNLFRVLAQVGVMQCTVQLGVIKQFIIGICADESFTYKGPVLVISESVSIKERPVSVIGLVALFKVVLLFLVEIHILWFGNVFCEPSGPHSMGIIVFMLFKGHLKASFPEDGVDERLTVAEVGDGPVGGFCSRLSIYGMAGAAEDNIDISNRPRCIGIGGSSTQVRAGFSGYQVHFCQSHYVEIGISDTVVESWIVELLVERIAIGLEYIIPCSIYTVVRGITGCRSPAVADECRVDERHVETGIRAAYIYVGIVLARPFFSVVSFAPFLEEPPVGMATAVIRNGRRPHVVIWQGPHRKAAAAVRRFWRAWNGKNALFKLPVFREGPAEELPVIGAQLKRAVLDDILSIGKGFLEGITGRCYADCRKIGGPVRKPEIVVGVGEERSDCKVNE